MLKRITLVYLFLPYFIFFLGWLQLTYAIPLCLLLGYSLHQAIRTTELRPPDCPLLTLDWRFATGIVVMALGWVGLSGIGGIGYQNIDYSKHNAVLLDLITRAWPVYYHSGAGNPGTPCTLVYYLAFYLPAALCGRMLGWFAANVCLFLWGWLGFSLALCWVAKLSLRRSLLVILVFIFASGLDVLGHLILYGKVTLGSAHLEWWAAYYQYPANSSLLVWVPQHAIGGWLTTALVLNEIFTSKNAALLALIVAASTFWSPLVSVGLVPLALVGCCHNRRLTGTVHIVTAVLVSTVIGLYYLSALYPPPRGILAPSRLLLLFLTLEVAPHFYLCFRSTGLLKGESRAVMVVSLVSLCLIPLVRVGLFNDFAMRSSIPALFVLWIFVLRALHNRVDTRAKACGVILAVVLFIGAFTAVAELGRSLQHYRCQPPLEASVQTVPNVHPQAVARQYMGSPKSFFFKYLAKP